MSTAQSAHYIVDESGALHDGNTWGMGNTGRWGIPNRWRVQSGLVLTFQGVTRWNVLAPGAVLPVARFATWREAMDYADRMARTREVVLPRPQLNEDGKVEFDFNEWSGLDYTPEWPDGATYDRRTGPNNPAFGASVWIPREHWKPLALVLLALAEQEKA